MYDVSESVSVSYPDTTARKVSVSYLDTESGEVFVSYLDTFKKYLWTPLGFGTNSLKVTLIWKFIYPIPIQSSVLFVWRGNAAFFWPSTLFICEHHKEKYGNLLQVWLVQYVRILRELKKGVDHRERGMPFPEGNNAHDDNVETNQQFSDKKSWWFWRWYHQQQTHSVVLPIFIHQLELLHQPFFAILTYF